LAGKNAPDAEGQVVVDLNGVSMTAHYDKEEAAATWDNTCAHHSLMAFLDHGPSCTR